MIASGSEVALAVEAHELLLQESIATRVVSFPSWELFESQSADYQASVLPSGVPKISIEAATTFGWQRWVEGGVAVGVDRYGASAPYSDLAGEYGFTAAAVATRARALLEACPAGD